MKIEQSIVLELCKFTNPNKEKIMEMLKEVSDYPFVLGHLIYNRMGAIAYETIRKCDLVGNVNREFCNSLANIYEMNCERTKSYNKTLEMISEVLEGVDFPYALLKGAYLISVYPLGLRTSNDIDILIEQHNITKVANLLQRNGFIQGNLRNGVFVPATRLEIIKSRMNRGETVPFVKKVDLPKLMYCEIDINFSIDSIAYQKTDIVNTMLHDVKKMILDTSYTLLPLDFLIHLCVHLFKEATVINWVKMGRDLSLYKFCDIYLLLEKWMDEDFSRNLSNKILDYGLNKECYYALYYTKKLFGIENIILDSLLNEIKPNNVEYLKEVVDIEKGKTYYHEKDIIDWFFCGNRKELLFEKKNYSV